MEYEREVDYSQRGGSSENNVRNADKPKDIPDDVWDIIEEELELMIRG